MASDGRPLPGSQRDGRLSARSSQAEAARERSPNSIHGGSTPMTSSPPKDRTPRDHLPDDSVSTQDRCGAQTFRLHRLLNPRLSQPQSRTTGRPPSSPSLPPHAEVIPTLITFWELATASPAITPAPPPIGSSYTAPSGQANSNYHDLEATAFVSEISLYFQSTTSNYNFPEHYCLQSR